MTCQTCDDEGVVDAADPTGCFLGVLREACPDCDIDGAHDTWCDGADHGRDGAPS